MIKIYMGIPSMGDRSDAQCYRLRAMEEKYKDRVQLVYPKQMCIRVSHDFARNAIVTDFLASDCDILWFLDSDVVPSPEVLDIVVSPEKEWKLAGSPYPLFITQKNWDGPQVVLAVYKRGENGFYPCEVPPNGCDFVDGIATGCLFIKKEVFQGVSAPYFEHKYDPTTRELTEGEDLGFCRKMNELGHRFYINFAHVCKHYKRVDLLDVNNYAITYANQHKLYYERLLSELAAKFSLARKAKDAQRLEQFAKHNTTHSKGIVVAQPHVDVKRILSSTHR